MAANAKKKNGAARAKPKRVRTLADAHKRLDKLENDNVAFWREMRKQQAAAHKEQMEYYKQRAKDRAEDRKLRAADRAEEAKYRKQRAKDRAEETAARKQRMKEERAREKKNRELDRRIATIGDRLGGLANAEGDIFEHECYEAVDKAKALGGVHFDFVRANVTNGYEYDVVGVNKKVVVPMEAKQTLRARDVRKFAKTRLREFPRLLPEYAEGRKVTGAMIFRRAPIEKLPNGDKEDPIEVAMELGLMVVQAFGKNRLEVVTSASKVRRK